MGHVVVRGWREDSTCGEAIRACSPPVREGRWLQFFLVCFFLGRVFAATIHCYVWGCQVGSASRDQATGLVVGGTHHNSSKGDTADPVVWSLFCSGLGDCCPIFALFA